MKLNQLTAAPGSTQERKRIGRGHGSGNGIRARRPERATE